LSVDLLARDTLNVDDVFESVDRGNLALATLQRTTRDDNFIVLSDRDGADLEAQNNGSLGGTWRIENGKGAYTPCFSLSSLDRGADMIVLRTDEGAEK
jgi:hypothetical protein